ncbi:MAG: hypothetical protein AB1758_25760, partial [Candidatus Eremiobacterota bacterium]
EWDWYWKKKTTLEAVGWNSWSTKGQAASSGGSFSRTLSFDYNEFLDPRDRVKVLLWREW